MACATLIDATFATAKDAGEALKLQAALDGKEVKCDRSAKGGQNQEGEQVLGDRSEDICVATS